MNQINYRRIESECSGTTDLGMWVLENMTHKKEQMIYLKLTGEYLGMQNLTIYYFQFKNPILS